MIKIPSTEKNLSMLFDYMCTMYDSRRYPDFEAVYQFVLDENGASYSFFITISGGKAVYEEGKHASPSITIHSPISVWYDIASGKLNGAWAWFTRKYHIQGKFYYLKMIDKLFSKEFTNEDIQRVEEHLRDHEIEKTRVWKKPDRVLVFNGSPHKRNGSTYFYLDRFIKGIEKTGAELEIIDIYDKNINIEPCRGCLTCWLKTKGTCVINDDANDLIKKITNSYLTIYAVPLYIESVPAKVKALLDRQFSTIMPVFVPYHTTTRHPSWDIRERYLCLFSVCGFPELENFDPLVGIFKGVAKNSQSPLVATILRPGADSFINAPPYLNYLKNILFSIEQAGQELIEKGNVSNHILNAISGTYNIPKDKWRKYTNLHWHLQSKGGNSE